MPKNAKPGPRTEDADDRTNPGGPSPEVLEQAREEADDDAPVMPGPGDATLVYDKNKRAPANEIPRLLVVAGPRTGSEYTLTELETSIGRGSENVVVIPDISVSRRHVVIAREGDRYVLIDQGSGNGTRLNGRGVDRSELSSGDDIAMGDTVVRFVEPGGVVVKSKKAKVLSGAGADDDRTNPNGSRPSERPSARDDAPAAPRASKKKQKPGLGARLPLYIAALGVLLVAFGVAYKQKSTKERRARDAAAANSGEQQLAQQKFDEGVQLLKDGKWSEARDQLKVAAELAPQDQDIQRYLARSETEAPRAQAIAAARAAIGKRDFAGARAQLAAVPDDSALADTARQLAQEIKNALDLSVKQARDKMEDGDAQAAADLIDPVLAADPSRADALAIRDAVSGQRKVVANQKVEKQRERQRALDDAAKLPPPSVTAIADAYLSGDIGSAMAKAEGQTDPRAMKLLRDLKSFDVAYREGLQRTQSHQLSEAIRALESADKIDRSIAAGRDSRLGKEVRRALGNLHYNLGVQAMNGGEDKLGDAAVHFRAAVADDPENDGAKRQLAEVTSKVKDIYQQGYFEKDSDPDAAKKAFKIVVQALPASDELQQKAKRWLDKLNGAPAAE